MTDIKYTDLPLKTTPLTENDEAIILDASNGGIVSRVKGELIRWPKGDRGEQWPQWPQGIQGIQWEPWKNGERWPTWPQGERWPIWPKGEQGMQWPQGNDGNPGRDGAQGQKGEPWVGVKTITSKKSGKTTTVTIEKTDGTSHNFQLQDGADGTGAGDMIKANNLDDLTDKSIARTNLDVYAKNEVDKKLNAKLDATQKGKALGVPELDKDGFIQGKNIPDWALNTLVFWSKDEFPQEGKTGKIYFEQSTRKIYVYNGSAWYKEYTDHIGITKSILENTNIAKKDYVDNLLKNKSNIDHNHDTKYVKTSGNSTITAPAQNWATAIKIQWGTASEWVNAIIIDNNTNEESWHIRHTGSQNINGAHRLNFYDSKTGTTNFWMSSSNIIGQVGDIWYGNQNWTNEWTSWEPEIFIEWWNGKNNFTKISKSGKYKLIGKILFIQANIYIEQKWEPHWVLCCRLPNGYRDNGIWEATLNWFICKRWENPSRESRWATIAGGERLLVLAGVDTSPWTIDGDGYVWRFNWVIPIQ